MRAKLGKYRPKLIEFGPDLGPDPVEINWSLAVGRTRPISQKWPSMGRIWPSSAKVGRCEPKYGPKSGQRWSSSAKFSRVWPKFAPIRAPDLAEFASANSHRPVGNLVSDRARRFRNTRKAMSVAQSLATVQAKPPVPTHLHLHSFLRTVLFSMHRASSSLETWKPLGLEDLLSRFASSATTKTTIDQELSLILNRCMCFSRTSVLAHHELPGTTGESET